MYDPEQITFFAKTDARGKQVPFGIKANDRTRHVYVIGKTGMGKSTLLENMAVQDIKNGNGLAFIDPHGQTAETLLDYIPEERKDDVVYFAPFDTDNPVSFNVMEDVGEDKRHLVVSGLMSVFKKIWVDAWSARMEYILSNTLLALLEYPDSTLLGVNRMLSDKDYRMRVIENITDPAVKSFWVDEFLKYNERYMQEAGDAIKNKIGQFTSNPLIRNIIGQPHSSFDIREIMDDKKILIMNLSKGLVGDQNANLLGSMLTTRIYLAAMSRANLTAEEMKVTPNFYFYVDEFQSFANATFADILSEARKYKLNLTIAHQYIEQMEEEVRNAVFGNVGTIISFRVGPFDAEVLETVYTPKFLAPDIVNLGFAQIYLTLMIDGIGSTPFSATTLPPIEITGASFKEIVVSRSRELYSEKRAPVEEKIQQWHSKSFSNKPPYIPKHLREEADGGTLPNTGDNLKKAASNGTSGAKKPYGKPDSKTSEKRSVSKTQRDSSLRRDNEPKKEYKNTDRKKEPFVSKARSQTEEKREAPSVTKDKSETNINTSTRTSTNTHKKSTNEKSLDDLRSVLKNISGSSSEEKTPQSSGEKKDTSTKDKNRDSKPEQSSLKNALAAALAGSTAVVKNDSKPEVEKVEKKVHRQEKGVSRYGNSFAEKRTSETNKTETSSETHTSKKTDDRRRPQNQSTSKEKEIKSIPTQEKKETPVEVSNEQREYAQMKNIDDPLSPKKLEKMMRTNTSDKPPIK